MERKRLEWISTPEPDKDDELGETWLEFRLAGEWYSTDNEKLYLPITVLDSPDHDGEPYSAILSQYGGESLLNDLLLCGEPGLDAGDEFRVTRQNFGGSNYFDVEQL